MILNELESIREDSMLIMYAILYNMCMSRFLTEYFLNHSLLFQFCNDSMGTSSIVTVEHDLPV